MKHTFITREKPAWETITVGSKTFFVVSTGMAITDEALDSLLTEVKETKIKINVGNKGPKRPYTKRSGFWTKGSKKDNTKPTATVGK